MATYTSFVNTKTNILIINKCLRVVLKNVSLAITILASYLLLFQSNTAIASGINFAIIEPGEYTLPVNYESFNVLAEYGFWQNDSRFFDSKGNNVKGSGTETTVVLSKYARFFTIKSIPDVGIAMVAMIPNVSVRGSGVSVSGFGDPMIGPAVWIKPSKNSTLGIQSYLQVPVGNQEISDRTWATLTSIFGDIRFGDLNIEGDTGFVAKSTRYTTGANDVEPGSTFHVNLLTSYSINKYLEPLVSLDYQTTGTSKDKVTGNIPNSHSNELAVGTGILLHAGDTINFSTRYVYGVDGKNTPVTNALYFKFTYIW